MSNKNQISREDTSSTLLGDIRIMIEESLLSVAVSVNAALTMLYWRIGNRINTEILKGERADYGKEILATLSQTLSWSHVREPLPLGIILCAGEKYEQIKLLELSQSGIHVAEYLTVLPPREMLQEKLHQAIELSRERLSGSQNE